MPGLVIFDVDGTLFQTMRVTVPAVQRTFEAFGVPVPDAETVCGFFGKPVEEYEAWLAAQSSPEQAGAIVEATNRLELDLIGQEGALYPGVRGVLEQLRAAGYRLAICSNGPDPYIAEFVRAHNMAPYFDLIEARGTRPIRKEDMVADILAAIPARPFAVVGDRHDDITAAHAHGGIAIAAAYGFGNDQEWSQADHRLDDITQLPALLERAFATV